jgi:hypothetical protein
VKGRARERKMKPRRQGEGEREGGTLPGWSEVAGINNHGGWRFRGRGGVGEERWRLELGKIPGQAGGQWDAAG